ncbi:exosome complex component RRP41 [Sporothrix brasiliensis 5110]|uniref:Ribosomal RNA-processing protein 41 n=1 Tax=Sporothrix brasiliensis 5110 TaxID=1398154 RepID=A0A0C2JD81_9PEZI|nr:exosome complex component RRP41 [Sporothrix brasiliensis 5110]KIH94902.1 exosome complex component RRP41 [Sporothrix brasiliensis 5110]
MPLDTSTYSLALLRVDGRRWNELRRCHAQVRTQAAADGSSYWEMGNTKVMCVLTGPSEPGPKRAGTVTAGGGTTGAGNETAAEVVVNIVVAGFSSVDRRRRGRTDKRTQELSATVARTLAAVLHTHLYPRSAITFSLHVLSQDGSLLAALLNAATLAAVDAGIPMTDYVVACSAGSTSGDAAADTTDGADPLLDLNLQEEQELPSLTVATLGATDRVAALVCESRVPVQRLEGMLAVAVDGCKQVRAIVDRVVREAGLKMAKEANSGADAGNVSSMEIDV